MSHTKGPWKVRWKTAFCNRAAIEPAIGEVYGAGDELRDNANLIAAAPELLETLEYIACADPATWDKGLRDQFRLWAQNRAKLAIAKAKGG